MQNQWHLTKVAGLVTVGVFALSAGIAAHGRPSDLSKFQQEAQSGKDETIKNFASQTVPTLHEHPKLARQMMQSVSGTAGSARSGSSQ